MLLSMVAVPSLAIPPPLLAKLPEMVVSKVVSSPLLKTPPPCVPATFSDTSLPVMVIRMPPKGGNVGGWMVSPGGEPLQMPPPNWPAEFPDRVLSVTVSLPRLKMAPPAKLAVLPKKVLLLTAAILPALYMAPPEPAELLPDRLLLLTA